MTRIWILTLFIASCWNGLLAEEAGKIVGKIIDAKTGEPLANVNVSIVGLHRGDVSNFAGEFSISGAPVGRHTLKASLLGYVAAELQEQIEGDSVVNVQLALQQDDAIRIEEILVTANRINIYPQLDLLGGDIDRLSPKDVGDFLRNTPGVSSVRKGGTAMDPVIRGFRQDQLNVQVDGGMKVWGACPNRMDPPTCHIQAEDLEKIEILKGPFSVRFGPTFGAVVNLVMDKPERFSEPGVGAKLDGGYESNWNGKRTRASVTAGLPAADVFVSGGAKTYGAYTAGDGSIVQAGFRMSDYSVKLGVNPSEAHRVQFTNRGSYMRDVYYPALPMDALFDDTHLYALDYVGKFGTTGLSSISAKGYLSNVKHSMSNQWKQTYSMMHSVADVQAETYGGRVEAVIVPMQAGMLYAGLDAYDHMKTGDRTRQFVSGPNNGKSIRDTIWQDSHIRDIGAFLEARTFVITDMTAIAGVRLDNVRAKSDRPNSYYVKNFGNYLSTTEHNVSAAVALLYTVSPVVDLRFGVGRGIRTADITERFVYLQPIGMDRYDYIGNPTLKPERNTQLELATNARVGRVGLQFSVYHSILNDYISARVDTTVKKVSADVFGVKRFVNISKASISGFEASATAPLLDGLRLDLSLAYSYGQNRDFNEPLPEMAPLSGAALFHYQASDGWIWAEFEGRFVARQSRVSTSFQEQVTPGFAVYTLRAGAELFEHVVLTAGINNILNTSFYEHLNRKSKADGRPILEPGRAFFVGVQIVY